MGRILAIDYGKRRIGLALSDPTQTIGSPYRTLTRRKGKRPPWTTLLEIVGEQEVELAVIGLPLMPNGSEGEWTAEVREFGRKLSERAEIPVEWIDERMTSVFAEEVVRSSGLPRAKREEKWRIDAAAASLILESYMESR